MKTKHSLLISGVLATVVTVFGLAGTSSSELDLPGLNKRIDNIDARTTNNEQDIKKLQESTGTAPAEHVVVPTVQPLSSTPAPTAAPATAPTAPQLAAPAPTPAPTAEPTPLPTCPPPTPTPTPAKGFNIIWYPPTGECR